MGEIGFRIVAGVRLGARVDMLQGGSERYEIVTKHQTKHQSLDPYNDNKKQDNQHSTDWTVPDNQLRLNFEHSWTFGTVSFFSTKRNDENHVIRSAPAGLTYGMASPHAYLKPLSGQHFSLLPSHMAATNRLMRDSHKCLAFLIRLVWLTPCHHPTETLGHRL